MRLITWITIHVRGLDDLLHYMDDMFGDEYNHTLVYYEPYNAYYPSKQAALLMLWDDIGLPHERQKQVYGPAIKIIGFWVDPRNITITMPSSAKANLILAVQKFVDTMGSHTGPLVEWQQMLGWINWGLNTFPLLRPALQSSYKNIVGKSRPQVPIYLNWHVI